MQGGRQGRDPFDDPFFTNPFGSSDPFSSFGGFGGPGNQRNFVSRFFGGRNPFDDPFFTRPFGGVFGSMESSFFSRSPFPNLSVPGFIEQRANIARPGFIEQQAFPNIASPGFIERGAFPNMLPNGFMEQQAFPSMAASRITNEQQAFPNMAPSGSSEHQGPQPKRQRGLIIEEINSDEENEEENKEKIGSPRKDSSSHDGHYVEYPDDGVNERSRQLLVGNHNNQFGNIQGQPPIHSFTFQSSSVTIGGANGPYYSSSMTRRTGSDGVTFEESKEADSTTREASHRIHKGLHDKGHSVARKLNSDGQIDTMQILHNLDEDELGGFQESWKNNAKRQLPGWDRNSLSSGAESSAHNVQSSQGGWALPSTQSPRATSRRRLM